MRRVSVVAWHVVPEPRVPLLRIQSVGDERCSCAVMKVRSKQQTRRESGWR